MNLKVIAVVALGIAIAAAFLTFSQIGSKSERGTPNVLFTEFTPNKTEIKPGEATTVVFNVQNLETRPINDTRVVITIEPFNAQQYFSISKQSTELSRLDGKDARSGQKDVMITATGTPAKEAVYTVKGILYAEGKLTDTRVFDLKVKQQ